MQLSSQLSASLGGRPFLSAWPGQILQHHAMGALVDPEEAWPLGKLLRPWVGALHVQLPLHASRPALSEGPTSGVAMQEVKAASSHPDHQQEVKAARSPLYHGQVVRATKSHPDHHSSAAGEGGKVSSGSSGSSAGGEAGGEGTDLHTQTHGTCQSLVEARADAPPAPSTPRGLRALELALPQARARTSRELERAEDCPVPVSLAVMSCYTSSALPGATVLPLITQCPEQPLFKTGLQASEQNKYSSPHVCEEN